MSSQKLIPRMQLSSTVTLILLAIIVIVSVAGNLYWVRQNTVLVGHDASDYLTTTMDYVRILTDFSPQAIFRALTFPNYRTPALYIAAQPFLWFFGTNADSAQYLNVFLSMVVIVLTYVLGTTIASRGVGLFAALLVSLLPLMAAMARLFYTEMFLAAAVVTNLMALQQSNRFARRSWSLVWGISLGIGLLVKWTIPIYIALPLLWAIWWLLKSDHAETWRDLWDWRRGVGAGVAAIGVALLWYWPNQTLAAQFQLGSYLWICWAIVVAPAIYGLMSPSTRLVNLAMALFLGMAIASLWYLPHVDVGIKLLVEDQARSNAGSSVLSLNNYLRNFGHFYDSNLGPLAFWLIIPAGVWPWLRSWWQRRTLNSAATYLWLSIASTFLVLSLILQQNPRNLVPILPGVAVLVTIALQQYRRPVRLVLGSAWVVVLGAQLLLYTTDALPGFYEATRDLWSTQGYAVQPASGETDPGYWVAPEILAKITQGTTSPQRLASLIDNDQLHRGVFKYQIAADNLNVKVIDVSEIESMGWYDLLSAPWVLVKDGNNQVVAPPQRAIVSRILAGDALFNALYQLVETTNLPNGENLYLYHRTKGPGFPHDLPLRLAETHELAQWITSVWQADTPLIYSTPDVAVWVGIHDPVQSPVTVLDPAQGELELQFPALAGTAIVVFDQASAGLQSWLDEHAYRASESGNDTAWAIAYGFAEALPDVTTAYPQWGATALKSLRTATTASSGTVLPVEIDMTGVTDGSLKLSMRLVGPDNTTVAMQDRPIIATDRFGLFVPPGSSPGRYQLVAVVYDPATMTDVPSDAGLDGVAIGTIEVVAQ